MASQQHRPPRPLPVMLAELTLASWETIARRSLMMAQGTMSAAEYRRMFLEKMVAMQRSSLAMMFPSQRSNARTVIAPWDRAARANAKRLRKG